MELSLRGLLQYLPDHRGHTETRDTPPACARLVAGLGEGGDGRVTIPQAPHTPEENIGRNTAEMHDPAHSFMGRIKEPQQHA